MRRAGSTRAPRLMLTLPASPSKPSAAARRTCARGARSRGSVAKAVIDGIATHYEVIGEGPPLLMYAPGGFDATIDKWRTQGVYARVKLLEHLPKKYRCIAFDRRECGQSGGRIEPITWAHYAKQGKGLLEHLGIERAHLIGRLVGRSAGRAVPLPHSPATHNTPLSGGGGAPRRPIIVHHA